MARAAGARLTPDRSLSVAPTRSAHGRRVTVYGDRPTQSAGFAEASRSPALTRIDLATGNRREERPADIAKTPVIEVWVERLTPAQGLDFGWHRVHDAAVTPIRPLLSATKPGARQRTRALELVKAQRYAELANEGLIAVLMRATLWGWHGLVVRRARSRCALPHRDCRIRGISDR
jgi:hypothetical protein